ncbi:MAG: CDP-alcohol phosphatidyltransferase family protein [Balneolaceae bacterium]
MSANSVTLIGIVPLFAGFILLGFANSPLIAISGALCINIWYVLDFVDGNVARYRGESSVFGAFLDSFIGTLYHVFLPLSVAILLTRNSSFASDFSAQYLSQEIWLSVAGTLVLFFCLRKIISQKVGILIPEKRGDQAHIPLWRVVFNAIDSFKAPFLLLAVIFTITDIWLWIYLVYMVIAFLGLFLKSISNLMAIK